MRLLKILLILKTFPLWFAIIFGIMSIKEYNEVLNKALVNQ